MSAASVSDDTPSEDLQMDSLSNKQMESLTAALKENGLDLGSEVGVGFVGRVFSADWLDSGQRVAVKIINKSRLSQERVDGELNIATRLQHRHVVQTLSSFQTGEFALLVMENMSCSLFRHVCESGRLTETASARLFPQLIRAVDYMHNAAKISHGGITCKNVLLDHDANLKLADFCLSRPLLAPEESDGSFLKTCRNLNYKGPEVATGRGFDPLKADMFSLGVVLFFMLKKKFPRRNETFEVDGEDVHKLAVSPDCHHLLLRLLHPKASMRLSTEEVQRHDWLNQEPNLKSKLVKLFNKVVSL